MPAQRCTLCNLNYALGVERCEVCREVTWYLKNEDPTPDIGERVQYMIAEQLKEAESVYPHRYDNHARVYSGRGLLWVTHLELLNCGYKSLEAGSIVFINGNFYELEGYSDTAQAWWIKEVVVDGAAELLTPARFNASP